VKGQLVALRSTASIRSRSSPKASIQHSHRVVGAWREALVDEKKEGISGREVENLPEELAQLADGLRRLDVPVLLLEDGGVADGFQQQADFLWSCGGGRRERWTRRGICLWRRGVALVIGRSGSRRRMGGRSRGHLITLVNASSAFPLKQIWRRRRRRRSPRQCSATPAQSS